MENSKKKFTSVFAVEMDDFVKLKRSLGYKYVAGEYVLAKMDRKLTDLAIQEKTISRETCDTLCLKGEHESPKNQANRVGILRDFCRYLEGLGYQCWSPKEGIVAKGRRYEPHIYSDEELKRFFAAVDKTQSLGSRSPYRKLVIPVFFRMLYTSGLRTSELRHAKVKDLNLDQHVLTVRQAKNNKDRLVPFHPMLSDRLHEILKTIHPDQNPEDFFFLRRPLVPVSRTYVYWNFRRCLKEAGIPHTGKGPRVHDFRHTFCVNLLRKWTAEGKDLMAWLPYMQAMLGHESFHETAYYLRLTRQMFPETQEKLVEKFPHMFKEITDNDEPEFY